MKDLIIDGMIQYHRKNTPMVGVTKLLAKHKHYAVGSYGIYIIKDYDKNFPYSILFGNVITHSFESLDAMRKWNLECNSLMTYLQFDYTINLLEKEKENEL